MIAKRRSAHDAPAPVPRTHRRRIKIKFPRLSLPGFLRPQRATAPPVSLGRWEMVVVTTLAIAAVLAVITFAAVISYSHMKDWALANQEPGWRAKLFPLSVDGAILASALVLYADSRAGRKPDKLAYLITLSGIGWSIGANVAHDWVDKLAAKLIAGWPPVAMALCVELLFRFVRRWRGQSDAAARKAEKLAARREPAAAPVPAPRAEAKPLLHAVPAAPEPEPAPATAATGWRPPEGANAKTAMAAYLEAHPGADAQEVNRVVGAFYTLADGYARRMVRQHRNQQPRAVGEES